MTGTRTDHAAAIHRDLERITRDIEPEYDEDARSILDHADALAAELAAERERVAKLQVYVGHIEDDLRIEFQPTNIIPNVDKLIDDRRWGANIQPGDLPEEGEVTT